MIEIPVETIVGWMDQLDPSGEIFNPQDVDPSAAAARKLCDQLSLSMQQFLEDAGYISTEQGWIKR